MFFKSGTMMPPALFFFSQDRFGCSGSVWLHRNFRIFFSFICKKSHLNFGGFFLWSALGS